jgi:hypothetical protein
MMFGKARLHLAALLAVTALLFLWPGQQAGAQKGGSNFNPDVNVEVDGYWVSGEENVRINSNLYANNVMYDAWVQFTPADWFVATGPSVPDGAQVGDAWTGRNLGLLNQPCNTWLEFGLTMLDCTTNTAVTVPWANGFDADANSNGLPDACDKYPAFLKTLFPGITPRARYYGQADVAGSPTSLNFVVFEPGTTLYGTAFDPGLGYPSVTVLDDPTAAPAPSATTDVCTNWQRYESFWQRSSDNPDTAANESNYLLRRNPPGWGNYDFATFVRGRPDADGDGIENQLDTCPLDGNWDENPRNGNGPDGDGLDSVCDPAWDVYNEDQDGDGYLNRGDNCPLNANGVGGTNQADTDKDGIGNACDPNPGSVDGPQEEGWLEFWVEVTGDSDSDGWSDALEKLAGSNPNWDQSTPEGLWRSPQACSDGVDNDLDGLVDGYDLGCDRDNDRVANMFDACPEDPEDQDGFEDADGCPDSDNDMDGRWDWEEGCMGWNCQTNCMNIPEDYDAFQDWDGCPDADNDNDGFPDVTDDCPATDWTAGPDGSTCNEDDNVNTCEDYDGIIDTDGCHDSPGDDYDADGFADEVEHYMGTDPTDACPDNDTDDAWPLDINMDTYVTIVPDVLTYRGRINAGGGPPPDAMWMERLDLNMDNFITIVPDILYYRGHINEGCT